MLQHQPWTHPHRVHGSSIWSATRQTMLPVLLCVQQDVLGTSIEMCQPASFPGMGLSEVGEDSSQHPRRRKPPTSRRVRSEHACVRVSSAELEEAVDEGKRLQSRSARLENRRCGEQDCHDGGRRSTNRNHRECCKCTTELRTW